MRQKPQNQHPRPPQLKRWPGPGTATASGSGDSDFAPLDANHATSKVLQKMRRVSRWRINCNDLS